jgi:hypothetical protein
VPIPKGNQIAGPTCASLALRWIREADGSRGQESIDERRTGALRYPSDLTDAEWALVVPVIRPAKHAGRPRAVDVREVLNVVF